MQQGCIHDATQRREHHWLCMCQYGKLLDNNMFLFALDYMDTLTSNAVRKRHLTSSDQSGSRIQQPCAIRSTDLAGLYICVYPALMISNANATPGKPVTEGSIWMLGTKSVNSNALTAPHDACDLSVFFPCSLSLPNRFSLNAILNRKSTALCRCVCLCVYGAKMRLLQSLSLPVTSWYHW